MPRAFASRIERVPTAVTTSAASGRSAVDPLYAGGEDAFCHRWEVRQDARRIDRGHRELPGKLVLPSSGTRVIFGA